MDKHFPLDDAGANQFRKQLAEKILALRDRERAAYEVSSEAMKTRAKKSK